MSIVFVWSEQYAVGVPELDKQHRFLFDLGNEIQKTDETQVKKQVMALYKYATAHFKAEERHMAQIGYPDFKRHQLLHERFITDLNALTETHGDDLLKDIRHFLHTWLIDHILDEDKKYFDYANEKKRG